MSPGQLSISFAPPLTAKDKRRLGGQALKVRNYMLAQSEPKTLHEISLACHAPEASVSARLRDLRAMGFEVLRTREENGLHRYSVRRSGP